MTQYSKPTLDLHERWRAIKDAYLAATPHSPEQESLRREYEDLNESLAFAVSRDIRGAR